jgi:hypothetical protein
VGRPPTEEGEEEELSSAHRLADPGARQIAQLLGGGADEDRHRCRRLGDGPTGDPAFELFGHDREVGELRHGDRSAFDPMVCYPGRVADNPIVACERVVPVVSMKEHRSSV